MPLHPTLRHAAIATTLGLFAVSYRADAPPDDTRDAAMPDESLPVEADVAGTTLTATLHRAGYMVSSARHDR